MEHVAAPDLGVGGRAHRGTRRLRTPARAGSGGPRLWDTWRHRTRGSAVAPTGARGGSEPLPERGAEVPRLAPGWLDDSGLLEVRLPLVEAQVRPVEVRDLSAGVRARGCRS